MSFVSGFAKGFAKAVGKGRIKRLLEELDLEVKHRKGNALIIELADECPLFILEHGPLAAFAIYSKVEFDADSVPDYALAFALAQNGESPLGKWEVDMGEDKVEFRVSYSAIEAALDAEIMHGICENLLGMVGRFDQKMKERGYS
jgi:hypothetical protein